MLDNPRDLLPEVRELLRRAILTCAVLPSPRGPRPPGNALADLIIHDIEDIRNGYGYQPPAAKRFNPTPRDVSLYMDMLGFLAWYQREYGKHKVKVFESWAFDVPMYLIAGQIRRGEDTIKRWRDAVALTIAEQFTAEIKNMLEGACAECGSGVQNKNKVEELTENQPFQAKTPNIWLAADNRPLADAHLIPGSVAEADHKKTVKRLERNARREARRKRA